MRLRGRATRSPFVEIASASSRPSSLSLRSSYAGHHASPFRSRVAVPRVARRAKRGGPGRTRTCNQTVMSGRIHLGFVGFIAFYQRSSGFVASWRGRFWCETGAVRERPLYKISIQYLKVVQSGHGRGSPLRLELCTRGCRTRCQTLSLSIAIASVGFNRGSFNSSRMPFNTALSKSRKLSWRLILRVLAALRVCDEACRCPRAAVSCVRGIRVTLASTRPRRCILAMITVELIRAKRRWSMSQTAPAATIGRRFALVLVSVTSVQAAHCRRS